MSEKVTWPLPYMIEMDSGKRSMAILNLPGQPTISDNVAGLGEVLIPVGGLSSDLGLEIANSVKGRVPDPILANVYSDPVSPPDLIRIDAVHIVSEKFRVLVSPLVKNTEFLPMAVTLRSNSAREDRDSEVGILRDDYYLMNCWNRLDLFDKDNSVLRQIPAWALVGMEHSPANISNWELLSLRSIPVDEHLFGIIGLTGGRRFLSQFIWNKIVDAGLVVGFQAKALDRRQGQASNELNCAYNYALNSHRAGIA